MSCIKSLLYLIRQRKVVLIIALFFALVLFNTTYLGLGTYVPIAIIVLGIVTFCFSSKSQANKKNVCFIWLSFIILIATLISGGSDFRDCFKIFITVTFLYLATSVLIEDEEVRYLSLFIVISYLVYAVLVVQSIGQDTEYYGRAQIRILNSEVPLDPNVVSAVFVFPSVLSLYNLLYGKYKLLAGGFLAVFSIAIIALGSRGATISFIAACSFLLLKYFLSRSTSIWIKMLTIILIAITSFFVFDYVSNQNEIFGFNRILDFSGDDASNGRTGIWGERLDLFTYSPLWGYGVNYDVGTAAHRGWACHNTFIQVLHYGGLTAILLFMIPIISLFRRKTLPMMIKISLFLSVLLPICFIDTLQERTLWNFLIFYSLLSTRANAKDCLLWNIKKK